MVSAKCLPAGAVRFREIGELLVEVVSTEIFSGLVGVMEQLFAGDLELVKKKFGRIVGIRPVMYSFFAFPNIFRKSLSPVMRSEIVGLLLKIVSVYSVKLSQLALEKLRKVRVSASILLACLSSVMMMGR